jgi:hypothetical protein
VAIGCILEIGETFSDLRRWIRRKRGLPVEEENLTSWHVPAGAIGLMLVIIGVIGEGVFEVCVSRSDTALRSHDEQILVETERKSGAAESSAVAAALAASNAEDASGKASDKSNEATISAGKASALAKDARHEADSFEKDITSAKKTAADAEQHLANALQEAARAEAELERIRSPRSVADVPGLIATLKPLSGTEYTFNVFQDDESIQFTKALDGVLSQAGWVRKQPGGLRIGITTLNVFSQDRKDTVEVCIETGVQIHVRSTDSVQVLQTRSLQDLPKTIQSANVLRVALASHILPSDERNVGNQLSVETQPGEGPTLICVGKKP